MANIKLDFSHTGLSEKVIMEYKAKVSKIHKDMDKKKDDAKEMLGWLNLPMDYDKKEFARIKKVAKKVKKDSDILVVIGIGGSYLGARAVIEALSPNFPKEEEDEKKDFLK